MGSIRFETYYAGSFLVEKLQRSGVMKRMEHDGGDIILFELSNGTRISIHLIESALPLYEIRKTLVENAEKQIFTMFVLWADMMLPAHNQHYLPDDWMQALYTLNGGHIYGYDYFNSEVFVFPVYFRGTSGPRYIEYGTTVHPGTITGKVLETRLPGFVDKWHVAYFENSSSSTVSTQLTELTPYFTLLGVTVDDDLDTIKKAYRLLARRYHPDANSSHDATKKMQAINEAYQHIYAALSD